MSLISFDDEHALQWLVSQCRDISPEEWPAARPDRDGSSPFGNLIDLIPASTEAAAAAWEVVWRLRPGLPARAAEALQGIVVGNPFLTGSVPESLPDPDAQDLVVTAMKVESSEAWPDGDLASELRAAWLGHINAPSFEDDLADAEERASRALLLGEVDRTTTILVAHADAATQLVRTGTMPGDALVRQSILPVASIALDHIIDHNDRNRVVQRLVPAHFQLGQFLDNPTRWLLFSWSTSRLAGSTAGSLLANAGTIFGRARRVISSRLRPQGPEVGA